VSALAEQQQALLQALWAARPDDAVRRLQGHAHFQGARGHAQLVRGLRAYRSNGRELAVRALAGAYPAIASLLGEEDFGPLARSLWLAHPPQRGDLAHWGADLPRHIESLPELAQEEPYLADLARVEWALHEASSAADGVLDTASFQLLQQRDPSELTLVLAPGTACIQSPWPVASLALAFYEGAAALEVARRRLTAPEAEAALVWRQGWKPRLRPARAGEPDFVTALQDRRSLLDSLASAPQFDLNDWLAAAVQGGLLLGAQPL
jgi:hypothetical protein